MNTVPVVPETAPSNQPLSGTQALVGPLLSAILPMVVSLAAEFLLYHFFNGAAATHSSAVAGRVLTVFIPIYLMHRFAVSCFRFYKPDIRNLLCITVVTAGAVVLLWLGCLISFSMSQYLSGAGRSHPIPAESFFFAIPFAAGGLLLQSILGLQYGLVFAVSITLVVARYFPGQPLFALFALASTLAACMSLSHFRSRSAFIKAGLNVSLISVPFALAFVFSVDGPAAYAGLFAVLCGLLGGVLCSFLASGVAPILEYLGGYVTDVRLLEMATLDHPLLKELSVQAPGTWNHCVVMGMMAEAAADSIGANPVLVRVGAYFHDIGKVRKPLYFVENQSGDENRHNKLSTSMSALIIRTHVKDGIELASKHGLPRAVVDMIPQHHGTSRIEYFYEKARKEAEESGLAPDSVDESLYRYPGPRPQTREAGILMLADGVEAAARTLNEPDEDRVLGMVQKMINKVFSSGELNECDLTLRDLHSIARAFTRVLTGIYHQRVAYAEPAEKVREAQLGRKEAEDPAASPEEAVLQPGATGDEKDETKKKEEDLKRLGL